MAAGISFGTFGIPFARPGTLSRPGHRASPVTGFNLESRVDVTDASIRQSHALTCVVDGVGIELATFGSVAALARFHQLVLYALMPRRRDGPGPGGASTVGVRPPGSPDDVRPLDVRPGRDGVAVGIRDEAGSHVLVVAEMDGGTLHRLGDAIDAAVRAVEAAAGIGGIRTASPYPPDPDLPGWDMLYPGTYARILPPMTLGQALSSEPRSLFIGPDDAGRGGWRLWSDDGSCPSRHVGRDGARAAGDAVASEAAAEHRRLIVEAAGLDASTWSFDADGQGSYFVDATGDTGIMHGDGAWRVWAPGEEEGPSRPTPAEALDAWQASKVAVPSP